MDIFHQPLRNPFFGNYFNDLYFMLSPVFLRFRVFFKQENISALTGDKELGRKYKKDRLRCQYRIELNPEVVVAAFPLTRGVNFPMLTPCEIWSPFHPP